MFRHLSKFLVSRSVVLCVYSITLLAIAVCCTGAATLIGDLLLGYVWLYSAMCGGALVLLCCGVLLCKLNSIAWQRTTPIRTLSDLKLRPIAYTLGGPALKLSAQSQPLFVSLTIRKESQIHATQNQ